jgi:CHAT domain-containing protein
MRGKIFLALMLFHSLVLLGCASTNYEEFLEKLSPDEVQTELSQLNIRKRASPPRTLNDLVAVFGPLKPIPENCKIRQQRSRENLDDLVATLHEWPLSAAHSLQFDANVEFTRGRIKHALKIQGWSVAAFNSKTRSSALSSAGAHAGMSMLYGASGDASNARYYAILTNSILSKRASQLKRTGRYRTYTAIGQASVALARGNVKAAEVSLRIALHYGAFLQFGLSTISRAWMQGQLVSVLLQQGKLLEAEVEARKAILDLKAYAPYDSDVAIVAAQLAAVLAEQERNQEAILTARHAINMFEAECVLPESIAYAQARRILIQVLVAGGEWESAYREVIKARQELEAVPESFGRLYLSTTEVGLALIKGGEIQAGFDVLSASLEATLERSARDSDEYNEAQALVGVANVFAGQTLKAGEIFDEVIPRILKPKQTAIRIGSAAHSVREQLILENALELYALALQDMSSTGKIAETEATMFRISQAVRLSRVQRAFSAAAARGAATSAELRGLVRNLQDARNHLTSTLESLSFLTLAPEDQVDTEVIEELNRRAATLKQVIASLSAGIDAEFPRYAQLINPGPLSIRETRKLLDHGEALLRIHVTENFTYVWAIAQNGNHSFFRAPQGRSTIDLWIKRLRSAIDPDVIRTISDVPAYDIATARAVYDVLLKPLEKTWFDADHVFVVTDAPLSTIPFSMLVRGAGLENLLPASVPFSEYRKVNWLVNTHAFSTLPAVSSLRSLELLQKRKVAQRLFVGFGDPDFSSDIETPLTSNVASATNEDNNLRSANLTVRAQIRTRNKDSADLASLPRLPETARELQTIARILGADEAKDVYLGKSANETHVKSIDLSSYQIIAFATHGLLPGDLDGLDRPALALSAPVETSELDDGLLTTDEIVGLKLTADWAVLSACNTGAADGLGAEAVSGLGRAFIYAGASALLVSNWPVHSESTVDLMINLFGEQKAANLSRGKSLQQAQLALLSSGGQTGQNGEMIFSYAHPLFWAPFSIVGNGR